MKVYVVTKDGKATVHFGEVVLTINGTRVPLGNGAVTVQEADLNLLEGLNLGEEIIKLKNLAPFVFEEEIRNAYDPEGFGMYRNLNWRP